MSDKTLDLVAGRFRALGEPFRLRILQALRQGPRTVGELVQMLHGNQSNVSKHLQILHQAGILGRRREGTTIIYSLIAPQVLRMCDLVHRNKVEQSSRIGSDKS
jgi:DNA-binding transcriptional ArsR family regulator